MEWSLDYCLACDKQTAGETYCSQSCRLAELETSTNWSSANLATAAGSTSADSNRGSGFYLPPAINFAAYQAAQKASASSPNHSGLNHSSYISSQNPTSTTAGATTSLTPSSSHSSLSSMRSASSSQVTPISEQNRTSLLDYTNSFDNARHCKRRTWS